MRCFVASDLSVFLHLNILWSCSSMNIKRWICFIYLYLAKYNLHLGYLEVCMYVWDRDCVCAYVCVHVCEQEEVMYLKLCVCVCVWKCIWHQWTKILNNQGTLISLQYISKTIQFIHNTTGIHTFCSLWYIRLCSIMWAHEIQWYKCW